MVPSLERAEYLEDLRNLADNIVRDRLEHSDVHPLAHGMPRTPASSCEVAQSNPQSPTYRGASSKVVGSDVMIPSVEALSGVVEESQQEQGDVDVGPAFHIPMTQAKSLEDLPSQLDFDWQDSVLANPTPAVGAARNLDGELEHVGTPRTVAAALDAGMDTFVEVSQIAQEAVMDAMPLQPAEAPIPADIVVEVQCAM
jgi:hypothetical protein